MTGPPFAQKYQVVIPASVRAQVDVNVGDLLEAKVEKGKITFTPKSLLDRGIAESLADFKRGWSYGPFNSAEEMIASLRRNIKKPRAKRAGRSSR